MIDLYSKLTSLLGSFVTSIKEINSYDTVLYSAAGISVLAVGFLGVTTFTVVLSLTLSVLAGLCNFYFNSSEV